MLNIPHIEFSIFPPYVKWAAKHHEIKCILDTSWLQNKIITCAAYGIVIFIEIMLLPRDLDQLFLDFHPVQAQAVGQMRS